MPYTAAAGIAAVVAEQPGVAVLAQVVAVITPRSAPLLATAVVGAELATGLPKGAGDSASPAVAAVATTPLITDTALGGTALSNAGSPLTGASSGVSDGEGATAIGTTRPPPPLTAAGVSVARGAGA